MSWIDEFNKRAEQNWQQNAAQDRLQWNKYAQQVAAQQQPQQHKGHGLLDFLSTAGGIGGSLGGAAIGTALLPGVGTILGALAGGALGGGGGQVAENAITGDNLTHDVGQEALLNGIFGAGPIRAGSLAIRGAEALAKGAGKEGLAQAGRTALTDTPLRNILGQQLGKVSDNSAIRGLGLNASQIGKVEGKAAGRNIGQLVKSENLQGASAHDIAGHVNDLNKQFGKIVSNSGDIPKSDVLKAADQLKQKLMGPGMTTGDAQSAQAVVDELKYVVGKYGDTIPAKELNAIKSRFDKLVTPSNFTADPAKYNANHLTANVLRDVLRGASEKSGAAGAGELKSLGGRLSALRELQTVAERQSNLGRGTGPISGRALVAAVPGYVAGGPVGGLAVGAATQAINSRVGQRAISKGAEKAAEKLASEGTPTLGGVVGRLGGVGALEHALGGAQQQQMPQPDQAGLMDALGAPGGQMTGQQAPTNDLGIDPNQVKQAMAMALMNGDSSSYKQLSQLYDLVNPQGKGLNSAASGVIADTKTGLTALDQLQNDINNSGANNPIIGQLRSKNPFDTGAQELQAKVATAKQIVGKALEGGVLRKEDEAKYAKLLPTMGDTDAVANYKIDALRQLISSRLAQYENSLAGGSGGIDQAALGL